MPYISKQARRYFDKVTHALVQTLRTHLGAGNLNYVITRICYGYLNRTALGPKYSDYNEVIGVLESVKLELYRRQIGLYEDGKLSVNGDVYVPYPIDDGTQTDDNGSVE